MVISPAWYSESRDTSGWAGAKVHWALKEDTLVYYRVKKAGREHASGESPEGSAPPTLQTQA